MISFARFLLARERRNNEIYRELHFLFHHQRCERQHADQLRIRMTPTFLPLSHPNADQLRVRMTPTFLPLSHPMDQLRVRMTPTFLPLYHPNVITSNIRYHSTIIHLRMELTKPYRLMPALGFKLARGFTKYPKAYTHPKNQIADPHRFAIHVGIHNHLIKHLQ